MRIGVNMKSALAFALKYEGWHSYDSRCPVTSKTIARLQRRGLIKVNRFNQFRAFN